MVGGFIMVPVPEDRVMEVYALLGKPKDGELEATDSSSGLSPTWTADEIRLCYSDSSEWVQRFLRLLAEQPDKWILSTDLYVQLGYTAHQFAGALGAFGRRVRNRYKKSEWFFDVKEDPATALAAYRMTAENAESIMSPEEAV